MKILIDNGHGIDTKGKRSPDGRLLEYAQNRLLAGRIVSALQARGLVASLLVPEETDISLPERCRRTDFWMAKVSRNHERDQEVWRNLEAKGWYVIIVWECQLRKSFFKDTLYLVTDEIYRNGENLRSAQDDRRRARESYRLEMKARKERVSIHRAELP